MKGRTTTLDKAVYDYLYSNTDGDGFVDASGAAIARVFSKPTRTVQAALQRLQNKDQVYVIGQNRFVVVDKAK